VDNVRYDAGAVYCTVLTLTRRMSSNIGSKGAAGIRGVQLVPPSHALTLLSTSRKVKTTDKTQYTVNNANMEVMTAKSNLRDRLWSPRVLFHHEIPLRKKSIKWIEQWIPYTMVRTAMGTRHEYMPAMHGRSVISRDCVGEVAGLTIEPCLAYYAYDPVSDR
jgi:hypothetical protein